MAESGVERAGGGIWARISLARDGAKVQTVRGARSIGSSTMPRAHGKNSRIGRRLHFVSQCQIFTFMSSVLRAGRSSAPNFNEAYIKTAGLGRKRDDIAMIMTISNYQLVKITKI